MKTVAKILSCLVYAVAAILALAFLFVEGRLLFSLDWSIYDSAFGGCLRYAMRFLLALFALFVCAAEFATLKKKSDFWSQYLLFANVALAVIAVIVGIFATNYADLAVCAVGAIVLAVKLLCYLSERKNARTE